MTPVEKQFASLEERYPGASIRTVHGNGAQLVTVPEIKLPEGWNPRTVTVFFVVPVGYPAARPDTFWTTPLALANGTTPQATNTSNPGPGVPPNSTWFSWHPTAWNPNTDSILSYMRMIQKRLEAVQ